MGMKVKLVTAHAEKVIFQQICAAGQDVVIYDKIMRHLEKQTTSD